MVNAQSTYNTSSINVTMDDLNLSTCTIDSTANAFVIYEKGYSYFDDQSYLLTTKYEFKIKILDKKADNTYPIQIFFQNDDENINFEEVRNLMATTYNIESNQIVLTELQEKDIYEEAYNKNNKVIKFTHPNIQPGSVITYSYFIVTPFNINFRNWNF